MPTQTPKQASPQSQPLHLPIKVLRRSVESVQYGAKAFADTCYRAGIRRSMGAVGTSADNAAEESFFASLKREILPGQRGWPTARAARLAVFRWLGFYNHRRRHSTIGYSHRSPSSKDPLRWPSLHDCGARTLPRATGVVPGWFSLPSPSPLHWSS
ncbi:hypothetical protein GCM10023336_21470 [Streptomyces similanensis]|uniref:Integrase catalytic domain-containing protein n=2 Tax=Streptomyces similanensis TaxID=1274988 RepID=A0ABP9K8K7_9ACTN